MSDTQKQNLGFQTEVDQLLHLMTHSLYSNKEIFLRELISNASDALDKLRFKALSDAALLEDDNDLKIYIYFDAKAKTITVRDNGFGMSRDDIVKNLGTIARSGTKEFRQMITEDKGKSDTANQLIGQFGVGFYSAFIVADKVTVLSRQAGLTKEHGVKWESTGQGGYSVENVEKETRGTDVILHLKKDEEEFLDNWRLRSIITKYSDHIAAPILMQKEVHDEKEKKEESAPEYEVVNRATALWARPKSEITDEEYKELYKHISHDFTDPLLWSHNKVEGKQEYITLLYIPERAPYDLYNREFKHGLKLYQNRVFVMDDAEQFLPAYLRFVKGVVDCADLPLNISREILQSNTLVSTIKTAITKRVLSMLLDLAKKDAEKFQKFWDQFGKVIKEGVAEDFENKAEIAKILRFATTKENVVAQNVSLADYVTRMQKGQKKIYYITAESFTAAKNSPQLEIFRKKDIEVLLLSDRVDEWFVSYFTEYDGKDLQSVAKGDLDLDEVATKEEKEAQKKTNDDFKSIAEHAKKVLGDRVKDVRLTYRLTDSPACIVADEKDMNIQLQRMLKAAGQNMPTAKPILELNPEHPIIKQLHSEADEDRFAEWVNILFDQAVLAEGGQLDDPATFVAKINKLLLAKI